MVSMDAVILICMAAVKSVGTAVTMAGIGVYLHQRGFVQNDGKRTLALISQQVTYPLFLFTKTIYCNQDWSERACPDVTESLEDVWMLLVWPFYVVAVGFFVGYIIARMTNVETEKINTVLVAVAFGNSASIPVTLLTVISANFQQGENSALGNIDPTLYLAVYSIVYPMIMWGLGGWMLAPKDEEDEEDSQKNDIPKPPKSLDPSVTTKPVEESESDLALPTPRSIRIKSISQSFRHNVLNNKDVQFYYRKHRKGLASMDESLYVSELDLPALLAQEQAREEELAQQSHPLFDSKPIVENMEVVNPYNDRNYNDSLNNENVPFISPRARTHKRELSTQSGYQSSAAFYQQKQFHPPSRASSREYHPLLDSEISVVKDEAAIRELVQTTRRQYESDVWETLKNIVMMCFFQPPIVGAVGGILVAASPIRGILVDLVDRHSRAPLQWCFDGLYTIAQSAVPINMIILGANLSAAYMKKSIETGERKERDGLSSLTMYWIVIGKMFIVPIIGIITVWIAKIYLWDIPEDIAGAFYLVMMIVFIPPTGNNVLVMVELSGSDSKEDIAKSIALQFVIAPVALSITMSFVIGVASDWQA